MGWRQSVRDLPDSLRIRRRCVRQGTSRSGTPPTLSIDVRRIGDSYCLDAARLATSPISIDLRKPSQFRAPPFTGIAVNLARLKGCDDRINARANGMRLFQVHSLSTQRRFKPGLPPGMYMRNSAFMYNNYSFVKCIWARQICGVAVERAMVSVVSRNQERGARVAARGVYSAPNGPLRSAALQKRLRARKARSPHARRRRPAPRGEVEEVADRSVTPGLATSLNGKQEMLHSTSTSNLAAAAGHLKHGKPPGPRIHSTI